MADKVKRIGLLGNSGKVSCAQAVAKAARLIQAAGRQVFCEAATAKLAKLRGETFTNAAALAREVDLLLIFGGDGTLLRAARDIDGSQTPLLGINIGGLGFLTAVSSADLPRALKHVWDGEFKFEDRALIEAQVCCSKKSVQQTALNDLVISRGVSPRLIELLVSVDDEPVTNYRCDGLIVSSPTGSTAYSLAAGGALVYPTAEVFQLTPICPHTLTNRSLILPLTSTIRVKVTSPNPTTILSADGYAVTELAAGDEITIGRSRRAVRLLHLQDSSFFESLRAKLNWRGANL